MMSVPSQVLCPLRLPLRPQWACEVGSLQFLRQTIRTFHSPLRRRVRDWCVPSSSQLPWPSPCGHRLGSLLFRSRGTFTTLQDSLYATDCSLARPAIRAFVATLPRRNYFRTQVASYEASWHLPRPDFHRQVCPGLPGRTSAKADIMFFLARGFNRQGSGRH